MNIKNIMTAEVAEKEVTREYNKSIDKRGDEHKEDRYKFNSNVFNTIFLVPLYKR